MKWRRPFPLQRTRSSHVIRLATLIWSPVSSWGWRRVKTNQLFRHFRELQTAGKITINIIHDTYYLKLTAGDVIHYYKLGTRHIFINNAGGRQTCRSKPEPTKKKRRWLTRTVEEEEEGGTLPHTFHSNPDRHFWGFLSSFTIVSRASL